MASIRLMTQRYAAQPRCDGRFEVVELSTGKCVDTRETKRAANGAAQERNRSAFYYLREYRR